MNKLLERLSEGISTILITAVVATGLCVSIYFIAKYVSQTHVAYYEYQTQLIEHEIGLKKKILEELHIPPEYVDPTAIGK